MDGYAIALLATLVGVLILVWRDCAKNLSMRALILGLLVAELVSNLTPDARIVNLAMIDLGLSFWFCSVLIRGRQGAVDWAYWCLALHVVMLIVHLIQYAEQAPVGAYMTVINALVYGSALAIAWTHLKQIVGRVNDWIVSSVSGLGGRGTARVGSLLDEHEEK